MTREDCARICHTANKAWCEFNGDNSQPTWEEAALWQRDSAVNGVTFHQLNPDAGDDASHNNWMAEKLAAGWVYGETKNPDTLPPTHPCLVPFDQLPRDQQFKDKLFRTLVHAYYS